MLSSLTIAVYAVTPYLTTPLHELAGDDVGLAAAYDGKPAWVHAVFYAHIVAGGTALVLGPFQFWAGLRDQTGCAPAGRERVPVRGTRGGVLGADPGDRQLRRDGRLLRVRHAGGPVAGDGWCGYRSIRAATSGATRRG